MAIIYGVESVKKLIEDIGKAPARVLTKAAKAGANLARQKARADAPIYSGKKREGVVRGALKRGMKLKSEKKKTGKKVYQILFSGKGGKGEEFVRISKKTGKRSFYPASQEYGWKLQNGGKQPGKRFMRNAIDLQRTKIDAVVLEIMGQELDKLR